MDITQYPHTEYIMNKLMNKLKFIQTNFTWEEYEKFNEVYKWALENCHEGQKTASGGIAGGPKNRCSFYFTNDSKASVELVIAHIRYGCYKFVIKNKIGKDNVVSGKKALKDLYKSAKEFNLLDKLKELAVSKEEGLEVKSEIQSPMVKLTSEIYRGREFDHCYHIDANSSYFSRICEEWPEFKPLGEYLYTHRKDDNDYFKHVMTNSIGAMQSKFCLDINNKDYNTMVPYQLSKVSKVAINGTNKFIIDCLINLEINGFEPLLINTDGIWYRHKDNKAYHDDNEGTNLGQWKHDHKDVKLWIKSAGAYQYIENGKVNTVLRGQCDLDRIKPDRDTWGWKEFENTPVYRLKFKEYEGIVKYE